MSVNELADADTAGRQRAAQARKHRSGPAGEPGGFDGWRKADRPSASASEIAAGVCVLMARAAAHERNADGRMQPLVNLTSTVAVNRAGGLSPSEIGMGDWLRGAAQYRMLGPLEVLAGQERLHLGGPKQRAVLALLLIRAGQVVAADRLVDELWEGRPPASGPVTLRGYVSRLRAELEHAGGGSPLRTRPPGYVLTVDPETVDAYRFEDLVRTAREAWAAERPDVAAPLLHTALDLWRGPVLADIPDLAVVLGERARLEELRFSALETRIEVDLRQGRHREVAAELEALVAEHPLRENLYALRMLALYRSDRQAEALAVYRDARRLLTEELGIEPGSALRRLHRTILRQGPELEHTIVRKPGPLATAVPSEPFVGREAELTRLQAAMTQAQTGHGRLVLLAGESGIGKTRIAQELAAHAQHAGFVVMSGRVWEEDGAPAFWPWLQALRGWVERAEAAELLAGCGPDAAVLAQLVPAVAERIQGLAVPPGLEIAQARFRLFDAVTRTLRRSAVRQPLLLVLDDLHRADVPSLRLLQFLARELADARVLVLGTYLAGAEDPDHTFGDVLAKLLAEPTTDQLKLHGLSEAETARYIELATGAVAPPPAVAELHGRTEGNPFFLRELVRLGSEHDDQVPDGVLAVVTRRLDALSDQTRSALAVAAVAGRVFTVEVLSAAGRLSRESSLAHMAQAACAGFVTASPAPGRYVFTHALVRDAVYTALDGNSRAMTHDRVGEAIEQVYGQDLDGHLAELTHHFLQAGRRRKGARYAAKAGGRAMASLAYEEAARLFAIALEHEDENTGRVALLLAEAQMRAGDLAAARATCLAAAARARSLGRPRELAQAAALWYADLVEFGAYDPELKDLIDEALAGLRDDEPALRATLLARSATTRWWAPAAVPEERRRLEQRSRALTEEAVALARELDDPTVLIYTLYARHFALGGPEYAAERLIIANEIVRLAESISDRAWELQGRHWRVNSSADLDDFDAVDTEIDAYAAIAGRLGLPQYLPCISLFKALRTFMAGDVDKAEGLGARGLAMAQDPPEPIVLQGYGAQLWMIRREQGRLSELTQTLAGMVERFPGRPGWRAGYAATLAETGHLDAARDQLAPLAKDDFALVPSDPTWLFTLSLLADTCALVADTGGAEVLYELLLPFEHRCATLFGVASTGPVALNLGRLAQVLGLPDVALPHYHSAAKTSRRLRARPWLAEARRHIGRLEPL